MDGEGTNCCKIISHKSIFPHHVAWHCQVLLVCVCVLIRPTLLTERRGSWRLPKRAQIIHFPLLLLQRNKSERTRERKKREKEREMLSFHL